MREYGILNLLRNGKMHFYGNLQHLDLLSEHHYLNLGQVRGKSEKAVVKRLALFLDKVAE